MKRFKIGDEVEVVDHGGHMVYRVLLGKVLRIESYKSKPGGALLVKVGGRWMYERRVALIKPISLTNI